MKNFKLLFLFLVILFVSTEAVPKGRGGGRGSRGGGGFSIGGVSLEIFIIIVCVFVAIVILSCILHYYCNCDECNCDDEEDNSNVHENRFVTNECDQQPMESSLQRPNSANLPYTCAESRFDELPVTGHKTQVAVIPENGAYAMLQLKDNPTFPWN